MSHLFSFDWKKQYFFSVLPFGKNVSIWLLQSRHTCLILSYDALQVLLKCDYISVITNP